MADVDDISPKLFNRVISHVPLVLIALGLLGNTTSFVIYTFSSTLNKYSSMIFLSFIAVFNTTGLFIWNLNHYLDENFNIWIESINLPFCKAFTFIQYTSLQISGLLYSIISVDRFFTVISKPGSVYTKLPFGSRRSAYAWSIGIIILVCVVNLHTIIFNGAVREIASENQNETSNTGGNYTYVECYVAENYDFLSIATYIQLVLYSIIPFVVMSIFNFLLVMKTFYRSTNNNVTSRKDRKNLRITFSLVILTISFILMTVPGTIVNGLFYYEINSTHIGASISIILDCLMFLQQTMIFLISCLTNSAFLKIVKKKIFCCIMKSGRKYSKSAITKSTTN